MWIARLLLIVPISLASGCSSLIASAGKDLTELKTKEDIHAHLGQPCASGVKDGHFFEEYRTRQKISERHSMRCCHPGYAMCLIGSCGAIELFLTPCELYGVAYRTLFGQTIRVIYDATGAVSGIDLDGESISFGMSHALHGSEDPLLATQPKAQDHP